MRAINRKDDCAGKFLPPATKANRRVRQIWNAPRPTLTLATFVAIVLFFCSFGCAPDSTGGGRNGAAPTATNGLPEITDEIIRQEINDAYVRKVPEENETGEPISWRFSEEEPKEFNVVEKQMEGERATIIIDIKTQSSPNSRTPRHLAGQIRTKWELQTGWALRTWEIVEAENISLKYKNIPKPSAQNSNR